MVSVHTNDPSDILISLTSSTSLAFSSAYHQESIPVPIASIMCKHPSYLALSLYILPPPYQPLMSITLYLHCFGTLSRCLHPQLSVPPHLLSGVNPVLETCGLFLSHVPQLPQTFSLSTSLLPFSPCLPDFLLASHLSHLICLPPGLSHLWQLLSTATGSSLKCTSEGVMCVIQILLLFPDAFEISPGSGQRLDCA